MVKGILKKIGRRGATAAAVVAVAAGAVGVSAGSASADGWYALRYHASGHGVGVYSQPYSWTAKVAGDVYSYSWSSDEIYIECWTRGEDINSQGNVWYQIGGTNGNFFGTAYVYGAYADGNWYFHNGLRAC
ncbi:hypothetical protein ACGF12_22290 [Kitasatospora sp. NPDC048296]|jgi:hypothetical protein|uniref:hypothetical protein n=1 Tax=Kitasatospora sp. NPDC048296 TaxID=3364048 RepID=UPI0037182FB4